jgi:sterol desaturase/sphingolipid hydroxylase (fatty acid hydroxylase superfamily)
LLRHFANDFLHVCAWLLLLAVIFIPLERLWAVQPQKVFRRAVWTDLGYYFVNSLLLSTLLIVPLAAIAWAAHAVVPAPLLRLGSGLPFGARLVLGIVVGEFGYYWMHRWMHEVPFLWRFHAVHHSAEQIDWLVSTRAHPVDLVLGRLSGYVPMYVVGLANPIQSVLDPVSLGVVLVGTIWGFFIHANVRWRLGPLGWLVSTPAFHHWHHTNDEHANHNFSTMLPWVDRIFGTHYMPRNQWPPGYGIDDKLPDGIGDQLLYPLLPHKPLPTEIQPVTTPSRDR